MDALTRVKQLYTVGQLIHNSREVDRLKNLGLKIVDPGFFSEIDPAVKLRHTGLLIRCHGESEQVVSSAKDAGMKIFDATCSIVKHSQKIIREHAREAYRILIAGKKGHAEVTALLDAAKGTGIVISDPEDIESLELENRVLLIAQTTIDPDLFSRIRENVIRKLPEAKIIDTTCRFINKRCDEIREFGRQFEAVVLVGGEKSSNCRLLFEHLKKVNKNACKVASPAEIELGRFKNVRSIGITGGASTPGWQLDEIKDFFEEALEKNNPQGLNNRKGGKRTWRIWKNQRKTV